ncbi:MAG: signal recognition particle receptor subunit alpha, partial [Solirubrobacterales bacterium]
MTTDWDDVFVLRDTGRAGVHGPDAPSGGEAKRGRFFSRLRDNLARSREALAAEVSASFFDRLDAEAFERLEEALILADVGASVTAEVVGQLESEVTSGKVAQGEAARARLVELLAGVAAPGGPARIDLTHGPTVIMVVGVNGTGKTTTIGKLAELLSSQLGQHTIVAAADTYRAAAIE